MVARTASQAGLAQPIFRANGSLSAVTKHGATGGAISTTCTTSAVRTKQQELTRLLNCVKISLSLVISGILAPCGWNGPPEGWQPAIPPKGKVVSERVVSRVGKLFF